MKINRMLHNKKTMIAGRIILTLLVLWAACSLYHWLLFLNPFFASAVPGDPVHMGMTPRQIHSRLGQPDESQVMEDFVNVGWNQTEWRPTGEIILNYRRPVMGREARFSYSYHKRKNRVDDLTVSLGPYSTWQEAAAARQQAVQYAEAAFAEKGRYTFEYLNGSSTACRYRAVKFNRVFMLDISLDVYDVDTDQQAYYVNLSQFIF